MTAVTRPPDTLADVVSAYARSGFDNDALWLAFTAKTEAIPLLRDHRNWIEERKFGFGDRAFHYMWLLLLDDLAIRSESLDLLEIGVYKGQILSLWKIIAATLNVPVSITGITPLSGKPAAPRALHRLRMLVDSRYREDALVGNLHDDASYRSDIATVFERFGIKPSDVSLIVGLSQDEPVVAQVGARSFDVVYIDGGHRYDEVSADLAIYGPRVKPGGYLVVDDAGFFQAGTVFFKGFESVSRAVDELDGDSWENILNVGHNRVFRRVGERS